jgi:hypothetical protein
LSRDEVDEWLDLFGSGGGKKWFSADYSGLDEANDGAGGYAKIIELFYFYDRNPNKQREFWVILTPKWR